MWPLQCCEEMFFMLSSHKCVVHGRCWPVCHGVFHKVCPSHQGTWREFSLLFLHMLSHQTAGPREVPNDDGNISAAKGLQLHWFLLKPEKESTVHQKRQLPASYQHNFIFTGLQTTERHFTSVLLCYKFVASEVHRISFDLAFKSLKSR